MLREDIERLVERDARLDDPFGHEPNDIALTRKVADAVSVPVIASGGAGNLDHLRAALQEGGADAALAASIFHFQEYTIQQAREYLAEHGVPVRN